jgi:hypothetical protein
MTRFGKIKNTLCVLTFALVPSLGAESIFNPALAQARPQHESPAVLQQKAQALLNSIPNVHFSKDIPVNFPIPTYPANVTRKTFSNSTKGIASAAATIFTKDSPDRVYQWYQDACRRGSWNIATPTAQLASTIGKVGRLYFMNAKKDTQLVSIVCILDKKTSGTIISISWSKVPPRS